ncbi:MAG TPA: hypothetical protein VEF34_07475 [Syntrophobacteraceae bacterium]|nr:hypothetical protein [Syntrophobacteraceae bacterium]
MLIEETKRTVSIRPVTLIACFLCLIGLSAATTFFIVHVKYESQLNNKSQQVLNIRENYEALAHQNFELRNSLQKFQDEYAKLETRYKDLESKLNAPEQKNMQTASESTVDLDEMLVLKPTCVSPGDTTLAFDGKLRILVHGASDKDECQKGSAAVSYLSSDTEKQKLCLRTGKPESFKYQDKNYLFTLSGIAAQGSVYRYCISISLER